MIDTNVMIFSKQKGIFMKKSLLFFVMFAVLMIVSSPVSADAFEYAEEDIFIDAGDHQIPAAL